MTFKVFNDFFPVRFGARHHSRVPRDISDRQTRRKMLMERQTVENSPAYCEFPSNHSLHSKCNNMTRHLGWRIGCEADPG